MKRRKMGKAKKQKRNKNSGIADEFEKAMSAILELTDEFCKKYLNEEYALMATEIAVELCESQMPITQGKPAGWASGIIHALGRVNFLQDPSRTPHMKPGDVAIGFGVSATTMQVKSRLIIDWFEMIPLDPRWCTQQNLVDNPYAWLMDAIGPNIDDLNPDFQDMSYEKEQHFRSEGQPSIIKFPIKETKKALPNLSRKESELAEDLSEESKQ
jgi:hypothetical protein